VTASVVKAPRSRPHVEVTRRDGNQFIKGLAGLLLTLVDIDLEAERAAASRPANGDDQDEQRMEGTE
jgi:hypothetical protein